MNLEKAQCPLKARTNTFIQLVYHDFMFSFIQPFRWVLASFTTWHVFCQASLLEHVVLLSSEGRSLSSPPPSIFHTRLIQCTGHTESAHRRARDGEPEQGFGRLACLLWRAPHRVVEGCVLVAGEVEVQRCSRLTLWPQADRMVTMPLQAGPGAGSQDVPPLQVFRTAVAREERQEAEFLQSCTACGETPLLLGTKGKGACLPLMIHVPGSGDKTAEL